MNNVGDYGRFYSTCGFLGRGFGSAPLGAHWLVFSPRVKTIGKVLLRNIS